jgi:hypothetical protein
MEAEVSCRPLVLRLILCALASLSGCNNGKQVQPALEIHPQVLDLGTVAAIGQPIHAKFSIENKSDKEVSARLLPACACLLAGSQDISIKPQQTDEVALTISTHGRSGEFSTELAVESAGSSYRLPIRAMFVPQVFAFPSRVVFFPSDGPANELVGQVSIEAPDDLWAELDLQAGAGYGIEEHKDGKSRRFRITYQGPSKTTHPPLVLRRKNQESPVLTIPAIAGTQ